MLIYRKRLGLAKGSWKKLDKNSIMNIFNSIYDRVDMLIEGDGEPLPY